MKKLASFALVLVLAGATVIFFVTSKANAMQTFQIIPDVSLSDLRRDGFEVDKSAMKTAYATILAGKTWGDIQALLQAEGVTHRIVDEKTVMFIVSKFFTPLPVTYSCSVEIGFKDGVFEGVNEIYGCGTSL